MLMEFIPSSDADTVPEEERNGRERAGTEKFTRVLEELRINAGLSKSRLAELADLDRSYVSRMELGERDPSGDTVEALIKALDLDAIQADRLRASAGFRGIGNTIPHTETILLSINELLTDSEISDQEKYRIRAILSVVADTAIRNTFGSGLMGSPSYSEAGV